MIDLEKWRQFWSPEQADQRALRSLVANPQTWDFERRVHTDLLFLATTVPGLRHVLEPPAFAREVPLELVEIGVGVGRIAGPLSERRSPRHVTGVDISAAMLAECAEQWPRVKRMFVPPGAADWGEYVGRTTPADVVYSMLCLQHVPLHELVANHVKQAYVALRQGGIFRAQTLRAEPNPAVDEPAFHGATFGCLDEFATCVAVAGFEVVEAVEGLGCRNWLWITAVKP